VGRADFQSLSTVVIPGIGLPKSEAAWRGKTGLGEAWRGKTGRGVARRGLAGHGVAGSQPISNGGLHHGKASKGGAMRGKAGPSKAWHPSRGLDSIPGRVLCKQPKAKTE
jgi:hypothetical protein